jgi:hypothetical protein
MMDDKESHNSVDLGIIDVPWGLLRELDKPARADLRNMADYMMKEGGTIILFCSWQLLHVYQDLFEEKKGLTTRAPVVPGRKKGKSPTADRTTHSKYRVSKNLLVFAKEDARVLTRPQAKDQPVSGGEFAMIITRMRYNDGTTAEFSNRPEDLQMNVTEAAKRFGGKTKPRDGCKWVNSIWTGVRPPRRGARLEWPVPPTGRVSGKPEGAQAIAPKFNSLYCEKDPQLLREIIALFTDGPSAKVWDPLGGTFSSANASRELYRIWTGSEKKLDMCKAAIERYLNQTSAQLMWFHDLVAPVSEERAEEVFAEFVAKFATGWVEPEDASRMAVEELELMELATARGLVLARDNFPKTLAGSNSSWLSSSLEARAEALDLEVFEEERDGRGGTTMGLGLKLGSEHDEVEANEVVAYIYGKWKLRNPALTNNEIQADNFPIPHRLLKGIVLDCTDSVCGKINDYRGTGEAANVKAVCAVKFTTPPEEVLKLVKEEPDTLLAIVATVKLQPGDKLRINYGNPYWDSHDEQKQSDDEKEPEEDSTVKSVGRGLNIDADYDYDPFRKENESTDSDHSVKKGKKPTSSSASSSSTLGKRKNKGKSSTRKKVKKSKTKQGKEKRKEKAKDTRKKTKKKPKGFVQASWKDSGKKRKTSTATRGGKRSKEEEDKEDSSESSEDREDLSDAEGSASSSSGSEYKPDAGSD